MKMLRWLILIPVAAVIISFAITNREAVSLGLWPLGFILVVPLYAVALLPLGLGLLLGAAFGAGRRWSLSSRLKKSEAKAATVGRELDKELALKTREGALQSRAAEAEAAQLADQAAKQVAAKELAKGSTAVTTS